MLDLFRQITTFVFDVDGVLTDGTLFVFDSGEQARRMNIKDGYALQLAVKKGYRVAIFSGSISEAVIKRLNRLGIKDVFMDVKDKKSAVASYLDQHRVDWKQVLFMGDDIPDYVVMKEVGLPTAPADAAHEIRKVAVYVTSSKGGKGCVREVMEKVLRLNGHWELETDIASR